MRRHCDGNDPNLLRPVYVDGKNPSADGTVKREARYEPCDCGLVFDDVNRFVIYPHWRF